MNKSRRCSRCLIPVFAFIVLLGLSIGCGNQESQEKKAKADQLKASVQQVTEEAWNKGNFDVLEKVVTEGYVYHIPPFPDVKGLEGYKQRIKDYRSAFPDLKLSLDEVIVQGNTVAVRWTLTGTHKGQIPAIPIPPTGKKVVLKGCQMGHWKDGKVIEDWNHADFLGYLKQFGFKVVPPQTEEEMKEEEMKEEEKKDVEKEAEEK